MQQRSTHQSKLGRSNLSNYGSTSLKQLVRVSDHDIISSQAKKFDIISNNVRGTKEPSIYEIMGRKENVSSKITERKVGDEQMGRYMGISTLEQNMREEQR